MTHHWPGNVRELRNVISGLHFLNKERTVTLMDLPRDLVQRRAASFPGPSFEATSPESLKEAESHIIRATLTAQSGNLSRTATMLGISRPTLYRKMKAYEITIRKSG